MSQARLATTLLLLLAFCICALSSATAQSPSPAISADGETTADREQSIINLFAPPGVQSGRDAAALVIGAIAANFWLDGDVALSESAAGFFSAKTDPLLNTPDKPFLALVDLLRGKAISVPLFARLVQEKRKPLRLGFAWEDEKLPPPLAITFRTALERHCFTLNIPFRWERLIDAPLDLPEDAMPNQWAELRLNIVALPSDVFATPVANDARQVFGVRCDSHTVISAEPVAAALLTVSGEFLATVDPSFF